MSQMFYGCSNLKEIKGLNNFITNNVTNMKSMFNKCNNLISIDLSNFKTDKVIEMSYMFYECSNLKEIKGLNNLITNNVINMKCMFYECKSLISIDLSNFKADKVSDMSFMFAGCSNFKVLNLNN